jgi:hypothetical protein
MVLLSLLSFARLDRELNIVAHSANNRCDLSAAQLMAGPLL